MMKIHKISLSLLAVACLLLSSCKTGESTYIPIITQEIEITDLSDQEWTYFSFEEGNIVGKSTFLSDEEDAAWEKRDDWDFAVCGDLIKTNGGTSGVGQGGVLRDQTTNFQLLDMAPEGGYITDIIQEVK